jgi:hypothetical protein
MPVLETLLQAERPGPLSDDLSPVGICVRCRRFFDRKSLFGPSRVAKVPQLVEQLLSNHTANVLGREVTGVRVSHTRNRSVKCHMQVDGWFRKELV